MGYLVSVTIRMVVLLIMYRIFISSEEYELASLSYVPLPPGFASLIWMVFSVGILSVLFLMARFAKDFLRDKLFFFLPRLFLEFFSLVMLDESNDFSNVLAMLFFAS